MYSEQKLRKRLPLMDSHMMSELPLPVSQWLCSIGLQRMTTWCLWASTTSLMIRVLRAYLVLRVLVVFLLMALLGNLTIVKWSAGSVLPIKKRLLL